MSAITSIFGASDGIYLKTLTVGKASHATGKLQLVGTTSGQITVTTAAAAGTWTLTLPSSGGTANFALTTDGNGVGSWVSGQSIAGLLTSSTPQFARLGVGVAAHATQLLTVNGGTSVFGTINDRLNVNTTISVQKTVAGQAFLLQVYNNNGAANDTAEIEFFCGSNTGRIGLLRDGSNVSNLSFVLTSTEQMRLTNSGSLALAGSGPHVVGSITTVSTDQWSFPLGTSFTGSTDTIGFGMRQTLYGTAGNNIYGYLAVPTLVEAGSGVHSLIAVIHVNPAITNGAATATDFAGINITSVAVATGTTNATSLRASAPTAATNNYAATFFKSDGSTIITRFWGSGRIDIPNITTSAGLQTAVICQASNGEMIADSVACLASSERYKEDIRTFDGVASDIVAKLRPVTFNYKQEGMFARSDTRLGFIAEEAAALHPWLGGYDNKGNLRTIDDRGVLALAVKTIQEQRILIEVLSLRVDALRDRLDG